LRNGGAATLDYSRAVALSGPSDASLYLKRGDAYRSSGRREQSAADYQMAVAMPSSGRFVSLAAIEGLISLRMVPQATSAAELMLRRAPMSAISHIAAGVTDVAEDREQEALAQYQTAERLAISDESLPDLIRTLTHRAHFYTLRHMYPQAIADCRRVIALTADNSGVFDDWAAADLQSGQVSEGISHLGSAIGASTGHVGPDAQPAGVDGFGLALLYDARGRAQFEADRADNSLYDFTQAVALLPPSPVIPVGNADFRARVKREVTSLPGAKGSPAQHAGGQPATRSGGGSAGP
jgi:tetratricopeptide (TPR) repeat protein